MLLKAEANDQWSLYQARRIKLHNVELGEDILHALPAPNAELLETLARYGKSKGKYEKESEETKKTPRSSTPLRNCRRRKRSATILGKVFWKSGWC